MSRIPLRRFSSCTASLQSAILNPLSSKPFLISSTANTARFSARNFEPRISSIVQFTENAQTRQAVVVGFRRDEIVGLKLGGTTKEAENQEISILHETSELLKLPKTQIIRSKSTRSAPFVTGHSDCDLIAGLHTGQSIAFIGPLLNGRFIQKIQDAQNCKVLRLSPAGSASEAILGFLAAIRTVEQGTVLLLEDLDFFAEHFARVQKETGGILPFSFSQLVSSALDLSGVTVVAFATSRESFDSAIGLSADVVINVDRFGFCDLDSLLRTSSSHSAGSLYDKRTRAEIRAKLVHGQNLKNELQLRKDLGIHVDFWETEELYNHSAFLEILRACLGDVLLIRAGLLLFFPGNRKGFVNKLKEDLHRVMTIEQPEVLDWCEAAKTAETEDELQSILSKIDQAILQHRKRYNCLGL